jgi:hypothetical protein
MLRNLTVGFFWNKSVHATNEYGHNELTHLFTMEVKTKLFFTNGNAMVGGGI